MKHFILILIALLMAGCADDAQPVKDVKIIEPPATPMEKAPPAVDRLKATWTVSDKFTDFELESITVAADNWSALTKGRVGLNLVINTVDEPRPWAITRDYIKDAYGYATIDGNGARISINAEAFADSTCVGEVWHVAAHEFGHTFGILTHGSDGVMKSGGAHCNAIFSSNDLDLFNEANTE